MFEINSLRGEIQRLQDANERAESQLQEIVTPQRKRNKGGNWLGCVTDQE